MNTHPKYRALRVRVPHVATGAEIISAVAEALDKAQEQQIIGHVAAYVVRDIIVVVEPHVRFAL